MKVKRGMESEKIEALTILLLFFGGSAVSQQNHFTVLKPAVLFANFVLNTCVNFSVYFVYC